MKGREREREGGRGERLNNKLAYKFKNIEFVR